jgi:hypothetical protein
MCARTQIIHPASIALRGNNTSTEDHLFFESYHISFMEGFGTARQAPADEINLSKPPRMGDMENWAHTTVERYRSIIASPMTIIASQKDEQEGPQMPTHAANCKPKLHGRLNGSRRASPLEYHLRLSIAHRRKKAQVLFRPRSCPSSINISSATSAHIAYLQIGPFR